jgi:hypothetical protein
MEVNAERDGSTIDAGFDLAAEKRLSSVLPTAVIFHERNGPTGLFRVWIESEIMQQLKYGERRNPRLALVPVRVI